MTPDDMMIKAEIVVGGEKGKPIWEVWIDGHKVAGPFMSRGMALEWSWLNGFKQRDGAWQKEILPEP